MGNYATTLSELTGCLKARMPIVALRTNEQKRGIRLVREAAEALPQLPFWMHTRGTGLTDLRRRSQVLDDKGLLSAVEYATGQFASRANATFVFVAPDGLTEDCAMARDFMELSRLAEESSGTMILLTDQPVWPPLVQQGMGLTLDPPDAQEMFDIIVGFLRDQGASMRIEWGEEQVRRAADVLGGVTAGECINAMAKLATKGEILNGDVEALVRYKDQAFSNLSGIESVKVSDKDTEVGGLDSLRGWLNQQRLMMLSDLRGTNLKAPRGVLLVGVPGCGKSLSAKAIASQWGLPLYRLDFASVLGSYVGQSEGQLREALEAADRVSPCVLWIDEIEKGLSGQNDSTGVSRRLVGQFLFWLQESTHRVFVVATANDVRALPPELLRKGRFDELFFVDLPTETEREEIVRLYHRRYLSDSPDQELLGRLIQVSQGFSGADIEAALRQSGTLVFTRGMRAAEEGQATREPGEPDALFHYRLGLPLVSPDEVVAEFANTIPLSRTNPEVIHEIREWGRERAVPAGQREAAEQQPGAPRRRVVLK